jgi:hypothetical protein
MRRSSCGISPELVLEGLKEFGEDIDIGFEEELSMLSENTSLVWMKRKCN